MEEAVNVQALVESISKDVFHKPFRHEATYNKRLRTTGGRYMLGDHSIQINPLVFEMHGMDELIGVIKHELCHYHLHIEGKGYQHRDEDFKQLLKATNSPRHCRPLAKRNQKSAVVYQYRCRSCRLIYHRKRRMDVNRYRCGKCEGQIEKVE